MHFSARKCCSQRLLHDYIIPEGLNDTRSKCIKGPPRPPPPPPQKKRRKKKRRSHLLGQDKTSKFSWYSPLSSYKTILKQQLNGQKQSKRKWKAKLLSVFGWPMLFSCPVFGRMLECYNDTNTIQTQSNFIIHKKCIKSKSAFWVSRIPQKGQLDNWINLIWLIVRYSPTPPLTLHTTPVPASTCPGRIRR